MFNKFFKKSLDRFHIKHWHFITFLLIIYDIIAINLAYFLALWFRFDCAISEIDPVFISAFAKFFPIHTLFALGVFFIMRLYNSIWRFASYKELTHVFFASVITSVFHTVFITVLFCRMPISYYVFGAFFQFVLILAVRFSYRLILLLRSIRPADNSAKKANVMIIGAGIAGTMLLRDINTTDKISNDNVVCIIDDNSNKWGRSIDGIPIVGGRDSIFFNVKKYDINKIYISIPSAASEDKRDILNICNETGCEIKSLPGIYQLLNGDVTTSSLKSVTIEDLLGRDPINIQNEKTFSYIKGQKILVTGGGGSIGSELCRQIAAHSPAQLIIFDIYENNAYEIQQELKRSYPELDLVVLIGSVRDSRRLESVFSKYRPNIVYHAAAHKHVPLMEDSPCESIKNNVIGTYKTAYAAVKYGTKRFILISTDKAVNPTNIMGASKRLCEMVVQSFAKLLNDGNEGAIYPLYEHYDANFDQNKVGLKATVKTEFVAVRFGNVLGSNGSVVPHFKKQIEQGGPVTVTHPDIIRYFMTIPEAVSLVLEAGAYAKGGEIFVLDMGDPVKIVDLARNLIKLSGYVPDVDIKIEYSGLRPGEKLYEEKLMKAEGLERTENKLIHICKPLDFDPDDLIRSVSKIMDHCYNEDDNIRDYVMKIVPTYHPANN
ncbi:MAG: polysaccharide biosynthesis protein [Clostridia bacterium]|nr:polysaccharide biosynthesis protein [Clostridia bacterium]